MIFLTELVIFCFFVWFFFIAITQATIVTILTTICFIAAIESSTSHAAEIKIHYKEPQKCVKHHPTTWCDYDGNRIYIRAIGN